MTALEITTVVNWHLKLQIKSYYKKVAKTCIKTEENCTLTLQAKNFFLCLLFVTKPTHIICRQINRKNIFVQKQSSKYKPTFSLLFSSLQLFLSLLNCCGENKAKKAAESISQGISQTNSRV